MTTNTVAATTIETFISRPNHIAGFVSVDGVSIYVCVYDDLSIPVFFAYVDDSREGTPTKREKAWAYYALTEEERLRNAARANPSPYDAKGY